MRVIAGTAKGKIIHAPKGNKSRPTTDRVKENLFNILGERVKDANVLDVFAGGGGLGLEALSRGASAAVFIDRERAAVESIRDNLKKCGFEDRASVVKNEAVKAIKKLIEEGERFDLIFLDPPYTINSAVLQDVFSHLTKCLKSGALVILETGIDLTGSPSDLLEIIDRRDYGGTKIFIFKYNSV